VVHPIAAFVQTVVVLSSVFSYSLATVALKQGNKQGLLLGIVVAILLGGVFIALELRDFADLYAQGATAQTSGFLSAFFLIIAVHGLHMIFGIIWLLVMGAQVLRLGLTAPVIAQLLNLRLFWQFQAAVWVCVYVFVYLKGAI
jgi:cytochrome o ubiquinol oxidase subunit 3